MKVKNLKPGDKFVVINPLKSSVPYVLLDYNDGDDNFANVVDLTTGKSSVVMKDSEAQRVRCFYKKVD